MKTLFKLLFYAILLAIVSPIIWLAWRMGQPMDNTAFQEMSFYEYVSWEFSQIDQNAENPDLNNIENGLAEVRDETKDEIDTPEKQLFWETYLDLEFVQPNVCKQVAVSEITRGFVIASMDTVFQGGISQDIFGKFWKNYERNLFLHLISVRRNMASLDPKQPDELEQMYCHLYDDGYDQSSNDSRIDRGFWGTVKP